MKLFLYIIYQFHIFGNADSDPQNIIKINIGIQNYPSRNYKLKYMPNKEYVIRSYPFADYELAQKFHKKKFISNGYPLREYKLGGTSSTIPCSLWTLWSKCTKSCKGGERQRKRVCTDNKENEYTIKNHETEECNTKKCAPVTTVVSATEPSSKLAPTLAPTFSPAPANILTSIPAPIVAPTPGTTLARISAPTLAPTPSPTLAPTPAPSNKGKIRSIHDNLPSEEEKIESVMDQDSEEFCEELNFEKYGGDYGKSKSTVFKYTNTTDESGFPIYFNEEYQQYMIRPPLIKHNFGDYNDNDEDLETGRLSEYTIIEGKPTKDYDSIALLQKLIRPRNNLLESGSYPGVSTDDVKCRKKAKKAKPASSIYGKWAIPQGRLDDATSWELGCTLKPLKSYNFTFFNTLGFFPGGYGGFQQTPDLEKAVSGKLAIISLWNEGENGVQVIYKNENEGIIVEPFGGEGTGQKAYTDYSWELGHDISIKIKALQIDKASNEWKISGYIKYGKNYAYVNKTETREEEPDDDNEANTEEEIQHEEGILGVTCGNHYAASCSECGNNYGLCNGVCKWVSGTCIAINDKSGISCGGHKASSCYYCGNVPEKCNGGCSWNWNSSLCVIENERNNDSDIKSGISCGGHNAPSCHFCGNEPEKCNGFCKWDSGICKAYDEDYSNYMDYTIYEEYADIRYIKTTTQSTTLSTYKISESMHMTTGKTTNWKTKKKQNNPSTHNRDYASVFQPWIHMVTLIRKSLKNPLNERGFGVFIEDWDRAAGKEGYLHPRSAEYRDPYLFVNGKRIKLEKPTFTTVKTGLDRAASHFVIHKEIGPPDSGNIFMSTGKLS